MSAGEVDKQPEHLYFSPCEKPGAENSETGWRFAGSQVHLEPRLPGVLQALRATSGLWFARCLLSKCTACETEAGL